MNFPFFLRYGAQYNLWTSRTAIDSALTGDPVAGTWSVYAAGGIQGAQFDLYPPNGEILNLKDCYRLDGLTFEEDPAGLTQTHPIPNSVGKFTTISCGWEVQYSRRSHLPPFNNDVLYGCPIAWPRCTATGEHPLPTEKLVILGCHVGLLDRRITWTQCESIATRSYPDGIAMRILRESQNHFQSHLPSSYEQGRACGRLATTNSHAVAARGFPSLLGPCIRPG